jgi:hypothetical protein
MRNNKIVIPPSNLLIEQAIENMVGEMKTLLKSIFLNGINTMKSIN